MHSHNLGDYNFREGDGSHAIGIEQDFAGSLLRPTRISLPIVLRL